VLYVVKAGPTALYGRTAPAARVQPPAHPADLPRSLPSVRCFVYGRADMGWAQETGSRQEVEAAELQRMCAYSYGICAAAHGCTICGGATQCVGFLRHGWPSQWMVNTVISWRAALREGLGGATLRRLNGEDVFEMNGQAAKQLYRRGQCRQQGGSLSFCLGREQSAYELVVGTCEARVVAGFMLKEEGGHRQLCGYVVDGRRNRQL
jgi:hypothetical protein